MTPISAAPTNGIDFRNARNALRIDCSRLAAG